MTPHAYERRPLLVVFQERASIKETYAGRVDTVALECHHLVPKDRPSDTVLLFMHPVGGTQYLPMVPGFARAGMHVLTCNSRYPRNDSALIMEKVALDLAACVRHAREKLGYRRVVLAGWSGGGSLSLFYQSQAEHPTVRHTPAGDPPDLVAAKLPPADGVLMLAAHSSRARVLVEWTDPSILDESRPLERDPSLNLYDPAQPERPPYSAAFLERYRAAQLARNRRITAWVQSMLADLRRGDRHDAEHCFVVHGTMAEPAWLDPSIDPNERPAGCYMGDPRMVNDAPAGLARFSSLRSWLSQFAVDLSNADGVACARHVTVPVCQIENGADDACLPHHVRDVRAALASTDKEHHRIAGAGHYYFDQPDRLEQALDVAMDWLARKGFTAR
jgi:alpha-beta hydrolase superfamily lysophospholipase